MSTELFLDREDELARLRQYVEQAGVGGRPVAVVEGPAGIGTSALLRRLSIGGQGRTFFTVACHGQVGQVEAYGPLVNLLLLIEEQVPRRKRLLRRSSQTVKVATPELLTLVPAVGPALKMAAQTLAGGVPGVPAVETKVAARAVANTVLQRLRDHQPVTVVIDDAHRIDASSCAALSYLAGFLIDGAVTIIVACRDDEIHHNASVRQLIEDLYVRGDAHRLRLSGLPDSAVADWSRKALGSDVSPTNVRALVSRTGSIRCCFATFSMRRPLNVLYRPTG